METTVKLCALQTACLTAETYIEVYSEYVNDEDIRRKLLQVSKDLEKARKASY